MARPPCCSRSAAAVIGGTSLFGGKGRVIDAVIGGLVIAVISNGLPLITQQAGVQYVVTAWSCCWRPASTRSPGGAPPPRAGSHRGDVSGTSHPPPLTGRVTGRAPVARPVDGQRRRSLAVLLDHLRVTGPLSRAELTARMGLNRSTIAALVAELAGLGAVGEERPGGMQTGAGRPSLVVRTRRDRL